MDEHPSSAGSDPTGPSSPRSDAKREAGSEAFLQLSREEMQSALFAQMVMQQSGIAMMLLGRAPNPQTGETMRDLESAQLFIDQLEMLEAKTRGNLTKAEETLLKQTLMTLRMAFVEATDQPQPEEKPAKPAETASEDKSAPAGEETGEESKKRFSKKFSL
jgi:uncharacterized membrane protein YccC